MLELGDNRSSESGLGIKPDTDQISSRIAGACD